MSKKFHIKKGDLVQVNAAADRNTGHGASPLY